MNVHITKRHAGLRMPLVRLAVAGAGLLLAMTPAFTCQLTQSEDDPRSLGDVFEGFGDDVSNRWHQLVDIFGG